MPAAHEISRRVARIPRGQPFTPQRFLRAREAPSSVYKTLERLSEAGKIRRLGHGVFVRPKHNEYVGEVLASPRKAVEALIREHGTGERIFVHSGNAELYFHLTTQVPIREIYYTTGRTRTIHLVNGIVELRHTTARKLALEGPAGYALVALWDMVPQRVRTETLRRVWRKLSESEWTALLEASKPAWLQRKLEEFSNEP